MIIVGVLRLRWLRVLFVEYIRVEQLGHMRFERTFGRTNDVVVVDWLNELFNVIFRTAKMSGAWR